MSKSNSVDSRVSHEEHQTAIVSTEKSHSDIDSNPDAIIAILFHRPAAATPFSTANHLNQSHITAFLDCIHSISSTPESSYIVHSVQNLDTPSRAHVLSIRFLPPAPTTLTTYLHHPTLSAFESSHHLNLLLQPLSTYLSPLRLAVFDMDSTLIRQEVIDLLAARAGPAALASISAITARAMNGELDFTASLHARIAQLAGLPVSVFDELRSELTITPGATTLLRILKRRGVTTALLSGGFLPLARYIADLLGIDHVHANSLEVDPATQTLTGRLVPGAEVVHAERKRELLCEIATQHGIHSPAATTEPSTLEAPAPPTGTTTADRSPPETFKSVLAVGDGANDLPMLRAAGLGIAVNAKPAVQAAAPARLNGPTALLDVAYAVGLTGAEIDELAEVGG